MSVAPVLRAGQHPNAAVQHLTPPPASTAEPAQLTLPRAVALHLAPGLLMAAVFVVGAPLLVARGFPVLFAAYLLLGTTAVVVEFGYLLHQGQRTRGRPTLEGVVLNRVRLPTRRYAALTLGCVLLGAVVYAAARPLDALLLQRVFAGWPQALALADPTQLARVPRPVAAATLLVGLVLNGLLGPVVEELYFRGYLLPRLAGLGRWAPVLNAALFSLYHFWTPWQLLTRFVALLPWVYAVQRTRSVYLGVCVHCAVNVLSMAVLAVSFLA